MAELYLTTEQVADRLQLRPETIRRQIQSGRLRAQAILRDLQSQTGRTRNAAIIALAQVSLDVRTIVEAEAAEACYSTPEGQADLSSHKNDFRYGARRHPGVPDGRIRRLRRRGVRAGSPRSIPLFFVPTT